VSWRYSLETGLGSKRGGEINVSDIGSCDALVVKVDLVYVILDTSKWFGGRRMAIACVRAVNDVRIAYVQDSLNN
jgi:hypothetical protein